MSISTQLNWVLYSNRVSLLEINSFTMSTSASLYLINPDIVANSMIKQWMSSVNIVCREFETPRQALACPEFISPACFLVSYLLPEMSGIELMRQLREIDVFQPVIFTSTQIDERLLLESMQYGSYGFIKKPFQAVDLITLVQQAIEHNGQTQSYFSKAIRYKQNCRALSRSEQRILTLLLEDKSANEVAQELNLSHRTVENHRQKIIRKMGVKKFSELSKSATICQTLTGLGKLH